jgi:hypothetical protein
MMLGMLIGLGVGLMLKIWIIFLYLRSGNVPFAAKGTTFGFTVALYLAGGVLAGALAGFLGPLGRGPVWAGIVGFLAALPLAWSIGHFGMREVAKPTLVTVLTSLSLGAPIGVVYRRLFGECFAAASEDGPAV